VSQSPALPGTSNGVSGVRVGSSTLAIPFGGGVQAPADWYFPTQVDGTIDAQGVIWLQHASGTTGGSVASLAADLARQTNSIVVAASLPNAMNWALNDASAVRAVASLFVGDRSALVGSAVAAGYAGAAGELTGKFVLAGHSAGGGFATAVAADYAAQNPASANLLGVIMEDGVSPGAFDGSGSFATQVAELDSRSIPVYQLAAPAQLWNTYGATTNALVATNPGRFRGVVLTGGSHVDAIVGNNVSDVIVSQRVTTESLPGNAAATLVYASPVAGLFPGMRVQLELSGQGWTGGWQRPVWVAEKGMFGISDEADPMPAGGLLHAAAMVFLGEAQLGIVAQNANQGWIPNTVFMAQHYPVPPASLRWFLRWRMFE
jgi:pimeloyl-ACP methyl ester carboxylesterase